MYKYIISIRLYKIVKSSMKNYYYKVAKDYIDLNGHLTEWGFYAYATKAIWNLNDDYGLLKLYKTYGFGPIIFDTEIKFLREVFEGDEIYVKPRIEKIFCDNKKFVRVIEIFNESDELCASFISHGAFLDHKQRKIIKPPPVGLKAFKKLIIK